MTRQFERSREEKKEERELLLRSSFPQCSEGRQVSKKYPRVWLHFYFVKGFYPTVEGAYDDDCITCLENISDASTVCGLEESFLGENVSASIVFLRSSKSASPGIFTCPFPSLSLAPCLRSS